MTNNITNMEHAIRLLSRFSTPIVSDAMAKLLPEKLKHQTMDSAIKPIDKNFKVCSCAYTVNCYAGATFAMEKAIAQAPKGSVIVCNAQSSDAGVMMGGLMSTFAKKRGIAGAVIDGAVRDVEDIIEVEFPIFARYINPRSGTFDRLGETGQVITCGSVVVCPDDIVIGDINGVVIVPRKLAVRVAKASEKLQSWEDEIKALLLRGKTLNEAVSICKFPEI